MTPRLLLLLLLLMLCPHAPATAQAPLWLDPRSEMLSLAGTMHALPDEQAALGPEQADAAGGWQPLAGDPTSGSPGSALWLRFALEQAPGARPDWFVEINNAMFDDVRLYQQDAGGQWTLQRAGRILPHSAWPLDTRSAVFPVALPPGRHVFLLRLQSLAPLYSAVRLWQPDGYHANARKEAMALGVYIGMSVLMVIFQVLFWQANRESISVVYVLYAPLLFLFGLMASGAAQNALDWPSSMTYPVFALAQCAILVVAVEYSLLQLELQQAMPRLRRAISRFVYAMAAIHVALLFSGYFSSSVGLMQIVTQVTTALLILLGAALLWRGHQPARFFLVSHGILASGMLISMLRVRGLVESNLFTEYSFQIGGILQLMLISRFIIERYNALKTALRVEQQAHQEQRDFVAMVSHEFRTPLAIINTSIEQLAANLHAPQERTLTRCGNIRNATRRLTDLMDEYLSLDRLEHTTPGTLRLQPCHLPELLSDGASDWPEERIRLTLRHLPDKFVCDPHLLQIALRNLLTNAHRHSPAAAVIEVLASGEVHGGLRIAVTDHGDGIAPEELPRLFQKYFRGRGALGKPGAGLGLFMVERIAHLHGGRVLVRSTPGAGATFEIRLPARSPH